MRNRDFTGMRPLDADYHANFSVARLRAAFEALPLERQRETLVRVRRRLVAEALRGPAQPSYLARIARQVYGIKV